MSSKEPTTVRIDAHALRDQHNCWDDGEVQEYFNDLLQHAPDTWDDDSSACSIAMDFMEHLVAEVKRLGGCLKKHCWDSEPGEWPGPCDHGYR